MKTKPVYVYCCDLRDPYGLTADAWLTKREAVRRRRMDIAEGLPVGPIVRVDVPLPGDEGRGR